MTPPKVLFIMADEGMPMNHCYVSYSICTPSLAAILIGADNA